MSQIKLQWITDEATAEWLKADAKIKRFEGRYGVYLASLVDEIKQLRKKCGLADKDGHPVK